jgi:hypothetical protein
MCAGHLPACGRKTRYGGFAMPAGWLGLQICQFDATENRTTAHAVDFAKSRLNFSYCEKFREVGRFHPQKNPLLVRVLADEVIRRGELDR